MNFGSFLLLYIIGFAGAFVHWVKLNTVGKVDAGEVLGFAQWLITKSPVKSISVWGLLAAGLFLLSILAGVTLNVIGYVLAFLYGYFLDSLFKRYTERRDRI